MSGHTITMMPTMCIPEKLDREALIEQINYLQDSIMQQGQTLHEVSCKLHDMIKVANTLSGHLSELVDSYDSANQEAINDHLKILSNQRKEILARKVKVH